MKRLLIMNAFFLMLVGCAHNATTLGRAQVVDKNIVDFDIVVAPPYSLSGPEFSSLENSGYMSIEFIMLFIEATERTFEKNGLRANVFFLTGSRSYKPTTKHYLLATPTKVVYQGRNNIMQEIHMTYKLFRPDSPSPQWRGSHRFTRLETYGTTGIDTFWVGVGNLNLAILNALAQESIILLPSDRAISIEGNTNFMLDSPHNSAPPPIFRNLN
ncbi:MAG: hypothetical protein HZA59_10020 [Hydrogenophilales bacterium]|nr:hypothetical protein [Hydrogenophilales bacterium]